MTKELYTTLHCHNCEPHSPSTESSEKYVYFIIVRLAPSITMPWPFGALGCHFLQLCPWLGHIVCVVAGSAKIDKIPGKWDHQNASTRPAAKKRKHLLLLHIQLLLTEASTLMSLVPHYG